MAVPDQTPAPHEQAAALGTRFQPLITLECEARVAVDCRVALSYRQDRENRTEMGEFAYYTGWKLYNGYVHCKTCLAQAYEDQKEESTND